MLSPAPQLQPRCVGVCPPSAHADRVELLAVLEAAFGVRFEAREAGQWDGLDGLVLLGGDVPAPEGLPVLAAAAGERARGDADGPIRLADDTLLERPLRDQSLDEHSPPAGLAAPHGATVLAQGPDGPVWLSRPGNRARHDDVALLPVELSRSETLRDRFSPGRWLALLPLLAFLRRLVVDEEAQPPPLRAAFILDDPNLRWPTYGHVRYSELCADAERHNYHVAMAMVPLDASGLVNRGASRLFRDGNRRLSLLVHGNNHTRYELGRLKTVEDAVAVAAQALRRIEDFERRTGVRVSRVMAPPHERLSEPMARALVAVGYEGVSMSRLFPWLEGPLGPPSRRAGTSALAGFGPAEMLEGSIPVLLRVGFAHPRSDLVLRAYLGQPLVLYGHQEDLAHGPDLFRSAAADINRLGDVRWCTLEEMARASFLTRRDGELLHVAMHARRIALTVPEGVSALALRPPPGMEACVPSVAGAVAPDGTLHVQPGQSLDIALDGPVARSARRAVPAHRMLWPLARRVAGELRDRTGVRRAPRPAS